MIKKRKEKKKKANLRLTFVTVAFGLWTSKANVTKPTSIFGVKLTNMNIFRQVGLAVLA